MVGKKLWVERVAPNDGLSLYFDFRWHHCNLLFGLGKFASASADPENMPASEGSNVPRARMGAIPGAQNPNSLLICSLSTWQTAIAGTLACSAAPWALISQAELRPVSRSTGTGYWIRSQRYGPRKGGLDERKYSCTDAVYGQGSD